jgi:hypothetical protein
MSDEFMSKQTKTVEELQQQFDEARHALEQIEKQARNEANEKLIGKCYRYRNSYGSGDKWWLYKIVTGIGDYWPIGTSFQKTSNGTLEIREKETMPGLPESYEEISRDEYNKQWRAFCADFLGTNHDPLEP